MLASNVLIRLALIFFFTLFAKEAFSQVDSLLIQQGTASYYGKKFQGRRTSSGEIFHLDSMTAAHKNLPFGTWVKVSRVGREESVVVKVNDRLPQRSSHVIDVSRKAGEQLGLIGPGFAQVRIEALNLDELDRLIAHFEEREKLGLRLRPYERTINLPKRELDLSLNPLKINGL
ncbi:septal ring lytic transglycosylase RlpA family protein [Algoriphagus sp. AK58]|uniref:septal ring lytic transglycosylase RlpA family protein n=1 Tax=Algoriphagus sp. AK58 TaxID=1406877 RepID=UPI00164F2A99|nr:septal ring lytic transglycosylase RlpA family protein [Algoriphagus sp. AK58]MBC6367051.1 septal ring lytic transglycosylase RlpA family lipoprotein [Algoriphagus sp. AK58]